MKIFLIDEWDCVIRERQEAEDRIKYVLGVFHDGSKYF